MISAGVEGRLPYMTYPEPWRGPPKPPQEFLRPAPKPLPTSNRYNGITNSVQNGTRLGPPPPQRTVNKYPSPPAVSPVNLTQHKEEMTTEELQFSAYSRLFTHPSTFYTPYNIYHQPHYPTLLRPNFVPPPPLSPLDTYSPTTPTPTTGTYLSPQTSFSPPSASIKPGQSVLRERKLALSSSPSTSSSFKVPTGKEGSLKHRILTRPEDIAPRSPLELQRDACRDNRKRLPTTCTTVSPPESPVKPLNNNTMPVKYQKGTLIQLANGEMRKVEDMRTEDFVQAAERSPELRLADSTVVRIEENPSTGTATITLSYNQRRTQVDVEGALEHPFFVYGQGWASCNTERTMQCYGLKVHRLQVGDILISLTPKELNHATSAPPRSSTIITTATTTAMTVRQVSTNAREHLVNNLLKENTTPKEIKPPPPRPPQCLSPDSMARKRRWSAPDQICEDDAPITRKIRID